MSAESVALIPQCAECGKVWLAADGERWEAYLTCDDRAGAGVLLPAVRRARVQDVVRAQLAALSQKL